MNKKLFFVIIFLSLLASSCTTEMKPTKEVLIEPIAIATTTSMSTPEPEQEPTSASPTLDALMTEIAINKETQAASQEANPIDTSILDAYDEYEFEWWNETVFYEIFVRSFADSDGDGIGDFNGLTAKLDYLNDGDPTTDDDLGITGIWLMPIMPSPSYHGYDITNYQGINPDYGTIQDFKNFLKEAHARDIKVIIDFVINHTSDQHPYFKLSVNPNAYYYDWYRWEETRPMETGPWGQQVWHQNANNDQYYFGLFWSGMPDLNYKNPVVTQMIYTHTEYWLNYIGVDGLRIDAARHLIEDGSIMENTPETHQWFKDFYTYYKTDNPDAMTVLEVWSSTFEAAEYVIEDESDLTFDFDQANKVMQGINNRSSRSINAALNWANEKYPSYQYATFLTNHDMNRVMSEFVGDLEKAKFAATVLLTSPGVPFLYYGEEIGMVGKKPDELIRTPMQWNESNGAGFTSGKPWEPINDDYENKNIAQQEADETSLLNLYKDLIHLRNSHLALQIGELITLETENKSVFAMLRYYEDDILLITFNMYKEEVSAYELSTELSRLSGEYQVELIYGDAPAERFSNLSINENGSFIYKPVEAMLPYQISIFQLTPQQ